MRYSTVVEIGVILWQQIVPGDWYQGCKISFELNVWLFVLGLGLGEMILSIRTWAVWNRDKKLGVFLLILWPICWGGGFAICALFNKSIRFDPSPMAPFRGCYSTDGSEIIFIAWIILLVYDTMNLVLISIPAYRSYRLGGSSQFVRTVYTDGIVYYIYLFALSALNIAVVVVLPRDLVTLLSMMERVLHSVLTCRVVLHIHAVSSRTMFTSDSFSMPTYHPGNAARKSGRKNTGGTAEYTIEEQSVDVGPKDVEDKMPRRSAAYGSGEGMKIVFAK